MTVAFKDDLFDAQFVRALAYATQGGAEVGECLTTAHRIGKADADLWYDEWFRTAERVGALAEESLAAGRTASARDAYLRASNYLRTAGIFLMCAC